MTDVTSHLVKITPVKMIPSIRKKIATEILTLITVD